MNKFLTPTCWVVSRAAWGFAAICVLQVAPAHAEDLLKNVENLVNIVVKSEPEKSQSGQEVERVELVLSHPPELKANSKAPWKLIWNGGTVAENSAAFVFEKGKVAFAKELPAAKSAAAQNSWQLTYFICDKEEKWCKKVVKQGSTP